MQNEKLTSFILHSAFVSGSVRRAFVVGADEQKQAGLGLVVVAHRGQVVGVRLVVLVVGGQYRVIGVVASRILRPFFAQPQIGDAIGFGSVLDGVGGASDLVPTTLDGRHRF